MPNLAPGFWVGEHRLSAPSFCCGSATLMPRPGLYANGNPLPDYEAHLDPPSPGERGWHEVAAKVAEIGGAGR